MFLPIQFYRISQRAHVYVIAIALAPGALAGAASCGVGARFDWHLTRALITSYLSLLLFCSIVLSLLPIAPKGRRAWWFRFCFRGSVQQLSVVRPFNVTGPRKLQLQATSSRCRYHLCACQDVLERPLLVTLCDQLILAQYATQVTWVDLSCLPTVSSNCVLVSEICPQKDSKIAGSYQQRWWYDNRN